MLKQYEVLMSLPGFYWILINKGLRVCPQAMKMYYYVSNFPEWQCLKNSPEGKAWRHLLLYDIVNFLP